ncbi:MAG: hypothetical protein U0Q03_18445 [Acidimicrobiales bacterium]
MSTPADPVTSPRPWWRRPGWALGGVVTVSAVAAVLLHRHGHTQGDDFALYLRQARSIFDGDIGKVVADNRFTVVNSASGFSPIAYPWGWPLMLAPFVKLWGLDYDKLKLLEVACFCGWLVMIHGVVRRRIGRPLALAITAVVGTAPALLVHTDQLLSEYPHALSVAVFVWWIDRVRRSGRLLDASRRDLLIAGALIGVTFQFRRETIVFVGVVGLVQVIELVRRAWAERPEVGTVGAVAESLADQVQRSWAAIVAPVVGAVAVVVGSQLLLPSMLLPENGNKRSYIPKRIGDYTGWLSRHLGLGWHPLVGAVVLTLMLVGMVIGVRRRPGLDGHLVLVVLTTMFSVSTHFRMVDRYYFQVLPWVLYFACLPVLDIVRAVGRRRSWIAPAVTALPLSFVLVVHAAVLPGDVRDAHRFNSAGRVQVGPTHPDFVPIYEAVKKYTAPTDVVAYFRARTMTLLTDRPTIQTGRIERIIAAADFFAQRRNSDYVQPKFTETQGEEMGLEVVWEDDTWVLWRIPPEVRAAQDAEMFAEARGDGDSGAVVSGG